LPTSRLPDALVADANVLLSAVIAGRARDALLHEDIPPVFAAQAIGDEVLEHLPAICRKRRLDLGLLLPTFASLPVRWMGTPQYERHEREARERMAGRDEDDSPTVALALALTGSRPVAIWTQDKDFEISGLDTVTTGALLDCLEGRSQPGG
jgi:predicted nucleic acid-binding protein